MSEGRSESALRSLPEAASLDWLRKEAKRRRDALRTTSPGVKLSAAQFDLAKEFGFSSWRALKAHIDARTFDGQLFEAAQNGDVAALAALLDRRPTKLHVRKPPYEWSLLHLAAHKGHLPAVDLLLSRGLDVNTRERGDNTYAMHWAAAAAHREVVRTLADAGGDVIGQGDDHELEVIGWATCWDGCDDAPHRTVVDLLIERGARHHIFSAIALNLAEEVRQIVGRDPSALNRRMSRNEDHRLPLHFAVRMNRPEMVALLVELGADPLATDGTGFMAAAYAVSPQVDRAVMERIRSVMLAELTSAERGQRGFRSRAMDLAALLALADWQAAERLTQMDGQLLNGGALHLMAKRNDVRAAQWLLARGADPNARWAHWDSEVTPLHLAILEGHAEVVPMLLTAGADPRIRDSKHDSDAIGWADFFSRSAILEMLNDHVARQP